MSVEPARSRPGSLVTRLTVFCLGFVGAGALLAAVTQRRHGSGADVAPARPRALLTPGSRPGARGAGGYFAVWPASSEDAAVARHVEYQYANMRHQADAALSGMWLFLTTEVLFFGALFLLYMIYRHFHSAGFANASDHARLLIGTINTVLLVTSSAVFSVGSGRIDNRGLYRACLVTFALGAAFLLLKGYEWKLDFDDHLFPGPHFAISGQDPAGAQLFWCFYFVATGLHGLHMIVGLGLVGWIAWGARRSRYSALYRAPVEVIGLYWSFVDMVWLCLFPMIYLVHRGAS